MTLDLLWANVGVVTAMMVAVWLISLPMQNVGIVDIAWGLGFVLIGWTTFVAASGGGEAVGVENAAGGVRWLLPILVTLWGTRLAVYLGWRNLGHEEDARYRSMRESWPAFPLTSLGIVFLLQAAIMLVVALPLMAGVAGSVKGATAGWSAWHAVGTALWAVGLYFEAVGDWQLARFKSQPENAGRVLDTGLWRYTRHPNYFGDFVVWWGFFLVAIGNGAPWWTVVGPVVMSFFLMQVSGVTLLEKSLKARKPEYAEYVRRTSTFFPWPPKPAEG